MKTYLKPDAEFIAFESETVATGIPPVEGGIISTGGENDGSL